MLTLSQLFRYESSPPKHRRRVFWGVVGTHAFLVLLTALSPLFPDVSPPKPQGIRVRLVAMRRRPDPPEQDTSLRKPPARTPSPRTPPPRKPTVKRSPTVVATAATAPKRTTKWRARSAADIRKTSHLKTLRKPRRTVPTSSRPIAPSPASIAGRINRNVNNLRVSASIDQPHVSNANEFYAAVSAVLHRLWQQPDRASVGSGRPIVRASVTVTSTGRILDARVTGASGITAMDESVQATLERTRLLPAPKNFGLRKSRITVDIVFELD